MTKQEIEHRDWLQTILNDADNFRFFSAAELRLMQQEFDEIEKRTALEMEGK